MPILPVQFQGAESPLVSGGIFLKKHPAERDFSDLM